MNFIFLSTCIKSFSCLYTMTKPISKSRFSEFVASLETAGVKDIATVTEVFKRVFDFDPDASTYDPVKGQQFIAWRRAKAIKNKEYV